MANTHRNLHDRLVAAGGKSLEQWYDLDRHVTIYTVVANDGTTYKSESVEDIIEELNASKPVFINCGNCVFFDDNRGECRKLSEYFGIERQYEALQVTPEDGCSFGVKAESNRDEA